VESTSRIFIISSGFLIAVYIPGYMKLLPGTDLTKTFLKRTDSP